MLCICAAQSMNRKIHVFPPGAKISSPGKGNRPAHHSKKCASSGLWAPLPCLRQEVMSGWSAIFPADRKPHFTPREKPWQWRISLDNLLDKTNPRRCPGRTDSGSPPMPQGHRGMAHPLAGHQRQNRPRNLVGVRKHRCRRLRHDLVPSERCDFLGHIRITDG